MLLSVAILFRLLVLPLAVVQKATDGRSSVGINLDEVKLAFLRDGQGLENRQNAQVLACVPYYPNLFGLDPFVDAKCPVYNPLPSRKERPIRRWCG